MQPKKRQTQRGQENRRKKRRGGKDKGRKRKGKNMWNIRNDSVENRDMKTKNSCSRGGGRRG